MNRKHSQQIVELWAESVIRCGLLDPKGMSEEQLNVELRKCFIDKFANGTIELALVTDHTSMILKRARRFRDQGDHQLACLLYATWVEHWLNLLISTGCGRRALPRDEIIQIIRDTPLRGKLTWLVRLIGLPQIAQRHRNSIIRLTDMRNGFVHYKWQGKVDVDCDSEAEAIKNVVCNFENTVKYLNRYNSQRIFAVSLARMRKVLRTKGKAESD